MSRTSCLMLILSSCLAMGFRFPDVDVTVNGLDVNQIPKLAERLQRARSRREDELSQSDLRTLQASISDLRKAGLSERALGKGDRIPRFTLPNVRGEPVNIVDLLREGPVVITFYRGSWCPYCNLELAAYQRRLDDIRAMGASLVAISPQSPDNSLTTAEKHDLSFEVLSDTESRVARSFGISYLVPERVDEVYERQNVDLSKINASDYEELPIPATFVVDPTGTIRYAYVNPDYRKRADPRQVIRVLRQLRNGGETSGK